MNELETTLAAEINDAYREAQEGAALTREVGTKAVEAAIRCGLLLCKAKDDLAHGEFGKWVEANCCFNHSTANNYMRLATNYQHVGNLPGASLRQAYQAIGVLPSGERRTEPQRKRATGPSFVRYVSRLQEWFSKDFERRPIETRESRDLEMIADQLQPVVDLHRRVTRFLGR